MLPHEAHLLAGLWLNQWRSPGALERLRERKLRRLIRHAYDKVPFYRALFEDRKLRPEDIRRVSDLAALPLVSKKDLQGLRDDEKLASDHPAAACKPFLTSGTTGRPLRLFYSRRDWTMMTLGSARAFFAMGMRPRHRMASFVGKAEVAPKSPKWYERLGVWRGRDLSSWDDPGTWIAALRDWRPQALVGYVMTLRILAEAVRDRGPIGWRPEIIISGSGVLDEFTRRLLASTFGCPIMDYYASYESGTIAWECRTCGGYHISSDTVIVEILEEGRPAPPGRAGEVVVTNLHSYAMPFIRYRQGDEAVVSPRLPVCGRKLPLMERIQGRADDIVVLSDGRKIPSHPFYYAIEPVPGVRRWKVVQESLQTLRVSIEPGPGFDEDSRQRIERGLKSVVGEAMTIELAIGPSLPIHASQKHRQVSSRIAGAGGAGGRSHE